MAPAPSLLFVTDPWNSLDHPRDTTLRLVQEASALGAPCFWSSVRSLTWTRHGARARIARISCEGSARRRECFQLEDLGLQPLGAFSMLLYRTDPPVDLAYLQPLQLIANAGPELVNPLHALCLCSEKLSFCPELMPESIASSDWQQLLAFGRAEGRTVVKPLHCCQSKGVELLEWHDAAARDRAREVLAALTDSFRRPVLLQRYLPAVLEGETRLWFVDGTLLGAVRKLPAKGTFCIDMDKGGTLAPHELTATERRAVARISACLVLNGIRLAAVDLIDGLVTDFNFTSPGLLTGMEEVLGANLAREVVLKLLGDPLTPALSQREREPTRMEKDLAPFVAEGPRLRHSNSNSPS